MIYGYCSVSSYYQNIDVQKSLILSLYPNAAILSDSFDTLLKKIRSGDVVVVTDIIKLYGKNDIDDIDTVHSVVLSNYQKIFAKEADIEIISFPCLNSSTFRTVLMKYHQKDSMAVEMAVSELLESQIKELLKEKLSKENLRRNRIKEKSSHLGNKKGTKYVVSKAQPRKDFIKIHSVDFGGDMSNNEIIKELGMGRRAFFKYKAELKAEYPELIKYDTKKDTVIKNTVSPLSSLHSDHSENAQEFRGGILDKETVNPSGKSKKSVKKASTEEKDKKKGSEKGKDKNADKKRDGSGEQIEGQMSILDFV